MRNQFGNDYEMRKNYMVYKQNNIKGIVGRVRRRVIRVE